MKDVGLTVGGFYKHFDSRDHLVLEAFRSVFSYLTRRSALRLPVPALYFLCGGRCLRCQQVVLVVDRRTVSASPNQWGEDLKTLNLSRILPSLILNFGEAERSDIYPGNLVGSKDFDLTDLPFEHKPSIRTDPRRLAITHMNRFAADSVHGERTPIFSSE